MTFQGDPYRTLGVVPGASLNEIRSAYRRLVKQYHPDAAGERALPRFLAIQAAYERLVDGEGRLRAPGRPGGPRGGGSAGSPREPWRADPARARASRDAWRARRGAGTAGSRPGGGTGATGNPGPGATDAAPGSRSRGGRAGGSSTGQGSAAGGGRTERHARRTPRKATPGSTTYDDAATTPRDPAWDGGAWYGPSSGTYWTLNPREYADPRKHGPEYLARARRAFRAAGGADAAHRAPEPGSTAAPGSAPAPGPGSAPAPEPTPETEAVGEGGTWTWTGTGRTTTDGGQGEWGTRAWTYDPGAAPGGAAWSTGITGHRRPGWDAGGTVADDGPPLPDLETLARRAAPRNLLRLARDGGLRVRLAIALVAWPPIGYAAGTAIASATGCASFSAACPEPMSVLSLAVQPFVLAALVAMPVAAAVGAFATLVGLAVALPAAAVLSVGSVPESRAGVPAFAVLTATAYLVALAAGARSVWRAAGSGTAPGSGGAGETGETAGRRP